MKKLILFITAGLLLSLNLFGQQNPQFSQYLVNQMLVNPGYTGSREALSVLGYYRTQWVAMEGAPKTANFSIHSPFGDNKNAIGANFMTDKIGVIRQNNFSASFAHRILAKKSVISMGLQATAENLTANFNDVQTTQANDPAFIGQNVNSWGMNFGVGVYWYSAKHFLGLGVPTLINRDVKSDNGLTQYQRVNRHYWITGGYIVNVDDHWDFKPSVMLKMVPNAPISADFNATFIYKNFFFVGATMRNFDAMAALLQLRMANRVWVGYAYDFAVNRLQNTNRGSHDIFVGMDLEVARPAIQSPRYF